MPYRPPSPIASDEHSPEALSAAARDALRDHGASLKPMAPAIGANMTRIAAWAWAGEGDSKGLRQLIVETAEALFRSPADVFYGRPLLAYPDAEGWTEALVTIIGTDTPLAQTLVAAAVRIDLMAGRPILPSSLAVLFRADAARIHVLVQKGVLEDASAHHPRAGMSGRRPKGAEVRVTAKSAFEWLREQGRVPPTASPPRP